MNFYYVEKLNKLKIIQILLKDSSAAGLNTSNAKNSMQLSNENFFLYNNMVLNIKTKSMKFFSYYTYH